MALYNTIQQVFDKVWDHFVVNQGEQSISYSSCQYRGPNGTRCAVGVCIPDDLYDKDMEDRTIIQFADDFSDVYEQVFNGIDPDDIRGMQRAHDYWNSESDLTFANHIEAELRNYANDNHLIIPEGATTDG